jgi:cytoskeletal protein RodZ
METLNVVITEILLCLALAWVLGFLAAWILFRRVQNEYEQEIEELEENLSYASSANKNLEREITMQNLKIQEFENPSTKEIESSDQKEAFNKKKKSNQDAEILKLIDSNLYAHKKK